MSSAEIILIFCIGAVFGSALTISAMMRLQLRMMRKSIKIYHEASDALDEANALLDYVST